MSDKEQSTTWGNDMDAGEHQKTYGHFLQLIKWGSIVSAAIVFILIVFVFS